MNYNNLSEQDLLNKEKELREILTNLKFSNSFNKLVNKASIKTTRKEIARVKTALTMKMNEVK